MLAWLALAIRALRGYRTYQPICECGECLGLSKVPWRYRLNQPPFVKEEE